MPLRYHFATSAGVRPLFRDKDAGPGALKAADTFAGRAAPGRKAKRGQKRSASPLPLIDISFCTPVLRTQYFSLLVLSFSLSLSSRGSLCV